MIGVEEHSGKDGGLYLLLFDPSHSAKQMQGLVEDIQKQQLGFAASSSFFEANEM